MKELLQQALDDAAARSIAKAVGIVQAKDPSTIVPTMLNPYSGKSITADHNQATAGFPLWMGPSTDSNKWSGFVAAPNGKLYGIPYNASQILEFDPVTKVGTLFGSVGTGTLKWLGGVLASDGKIYCIPFNATSVLVIDPVTRTTSTTGNLSGSNKWAGGTLLPDGRILGMPHGSSNYLLITPGSTPTTRSGAQSGSGKFFGGVAVGNNKVVMAPYSRVRIRLYDYVANTFQEYPVPGAGGNDYAGCSLTPAGNVVMMPYNAGNVVEFNPNTGTIAQYGNLGRTATAKYIGSITLPNGNVYGIPFNASEVLEFNPITKQIALLPLKAGSNKWSGAAVANDGKAYACPRNEQRILEIPLGALGPHWWTQSAYVNKL